MFSDKEIIHRILTIFYGRGIRSVVVSPGSRNAPIVQSFFGHGGFEMYPVPDERSAGFIALGMAMKTGKAVVLTCTSGSALLNYGPALVEAYYQNVPLIVLSADRPIHLIDQGHGQSMRQENVYHNYIRGSLNLPEFLERNSWYIDARVNQIIDMGNGYVKGPVHINLPLDEPLYDFKYELIKDVRIIDYFHSEKILSPGITGRLEDNWNKAEKVMIMVGQKIPDPAVNAILAEIVLKNKVVVLTEHTSNLYNPELFIHQIDRCIFALDDKEWEEFHPDLLITFGKEIVSKKIKKILLRHRIKNHWHIGKTDEQRDTFGSLSMVIDTEPLETLGKVLNFKPKKNNFFQSWNNRREQVRQFHDLYLKDTAWSDLKTWEYLMKNLPRGASVHLGNSASIRYSLLFDGMEGQKYFSNRGVSGIDGCTSTAIGYSIAASDEEVYFVSGDVSFLYDSNAFWLSRLPDNLKIIVINNSGGGIFRFIQGPSDTEVLDEFLETTHTRRIQPLVESYGIKCFQVESLEELQSIFPKFVARSGMAVLEVVTPRKENDKILKQYFNNLAKS